MKDFFLSYNRADRTWAEWIAWQLEDAGYTTTIQAWDFRPGSNFVLDVQRAAAEAERTIAVFSPDYLTALYTQPEWAAAFAQDPTSKDKTLLPVRVRECKPEGMLRPLVYIDLLGLDEAAAKAALLAGVKTERAKPKMPPQFPQATTAPATPPPRFPGSLPAIWNLPHLRNPYFTGRVELLQSLRDALTTGKAAALTQALHGLGGVGKTQLAVEYAYRFAENYDLVWWLRAEEPNTLAGDYAALAHALNLPEKDAAEQSIAIAAVKRSLDQRKNWLLIFDNAIDLETVRRYVPQAGLGHVLITSRSAHWQGAATALPVKTFGRAEAIDFLCRRTNESATPAANALAEALGDLPLALEQAAAYCNAAQKTLAEYLALFRTQQSKLLARGRPATDYAHTVATTWELAFQQVQTQNPTAGSASVIGAERSADILSAGKDACATSNATALLHLCAFLSPEEIPRKSLWQGVQQAQAETPALAALIDELAFDEAIIALRQYSLLEATPEALSLHRLVQAVTRDRLAKKEKPLWVEAAVRVLAEVFPSGNDPVDVHSWPVCGQWLRHSLLAAEFAQEQNVAMENVSLLLNQAGIYLYARAQYQEAEPLYRRSLAIREEKLGSNHPDVAQSLNNLAGLLQSQGKYAEAEPLYRRSLAIWEEKLGADHPQVATSLNNLAALLRTQGKYAEAEPLYRRSLAIREEKLGSNHPQVATSLNNLAGLLESQGKYAEAEPLYRRSLAIHEETLGQDHPQVATSLNNLAALLESQGKYEKAEPLYRRSLAIVEKQLGEDHPHIATSLNNLALLLKSQGKYAEAEPLYRRSLAIREEKLGSNHPDVAQSLNNLALLLQSQGKHAEAEPLYRHSLAIREEKLGSNHPDVAQSLNNLAALLQSQGKYEKAEPLFRRSLAIDEKAYGPDHPDVATDLNNLAELLRAQGKSAEAEPLYRHSLAIWEEKLGSNHPDVASSLNNLAALLESQGKHAEAEPLYRRAVEILEKSLGPDHPNTQTVRENYALLLLLAEMKASAS